jgi:transcriptional regulator with XRE-family HTH domain
MLILRLKNERLNRNLTQEQLAAILQVSLRTYQHLEHGTKKPSCDLVIKLQNYFNKNIQELLDKVEEDI